jgi:hypothetical protein
VRRPRSRAQASTWRPPQLRHIAGAMTSGGGERRCQMLEEVEELCGRLR